MLKPFIVLDFYPVGTLVFYSMQTEEEATKNISPTKNFYWKDDLHPNGVGPFPTFYTAFNDFKATTKLRQDMVIPVTKPTKQNITVFDFKTKKRVE